MNNSSGNSRLSTKQERAIFELLNPDNKSNTQIAQKLKVSERTLYNWLKLPHFKDRLEQEGTNMVKEAFQNLNRLSVKATQGIEELMESTNEKIKLTACQAVINYNTKILKPQELEKRISELEETLFKEGIR